MNIVLFEPEMPANTGNIGRTCVATGTTLHLIEPLGFLLNEKSIKRAGLDYWPYVDLEVHDSLEDFLNKYGTNGKEPHRLFLATTKGGNFYTDFEYKDEDMFLFGKETAGLPKPFINDNKETAIRIPMSENTRLRSFNLSNSANIILFEALRQLKFPNLK